ncbi:MAG: hypothetical protein AMXMBFR6_08210 [Betaproteobacteria bacterium]
MSARQSLDQRMETGPCVVLVDDDRLVLHTLGQGLRAAGLRVFAADCGAEAVRLCRTETPDLAIIDIRMPETSGIEVARQLRTDTTVPYLFLSASCDSDLVDIVVQEGAVGYLVKPLDASQIVPAIRVAIARAADLATLQRKEAGLRLALANNQKTSIAVGLLMERHRLSREEAFDALRSRARRERRKIVDVAAGILAGVEELLLRPPDAKSERARMGPAEPS